jgi:excisionase family DNA binding protein
MSTGTLDYNNLPHALTPLEAAQFLRISSDSYYRHIHPLVVRGQIKSYVIGRRRLILTQSLQEWQARQAMEVV